MTFAVDPIDIVPQQQIRKPSASVIASWQSREVVSQQPAPLLPAQWHQNEQIMKILSKAFIALGIALAVGATITFAAVGIVSGTIVLIGAVGLIALGILGLKKEYWNDHAYVEKALKGKTFAQMQALYALELSNRVIAPEIIRKEILEQYSACATVEEFMHQQGGQEAFYSLIKNNIIEPAYFREALMQQMTSLSQFIKTFGWEAFRLNVMDGQSLHDRLMEEVKGRRFSEIMSSFGGDGVWNLFAYKLASISDFKPRALIEVKFKLKTFENVVETFTWKAFEHGLLHGSDSEIAAAFLEMAARSKFCDLWDAYHSPVVAFQLIPSMHMEVVNSLAAEKQKAEETYESEIAEGRQFFEQSKSIAFDQRQAIYNLSTQTLSMVGRLSMKSDSDHVYSLAEKESEASCKQAELNYQQALTSATGLYERSCVPFKTKLEAVKERLNTQFSKLIVHKKIDNETLA